MSVEEILASLRADSAPKMCVYGQWVDDLMNIDMDLYNALSEAHDDTAISSQAIFDLVSSVEVAYTGGLTTIKTHRAEKCLCFKVTR